MFKKLLIANRGEIACRIIKTARRLGIKTVAVYSEADTNSMHVSMADEAVYIGPSPAVQSYLNIDKLLDAVRKTGADAVHPGYGFLSENLAFSKAVADEGVAFVGPGAEAIRLMGDKIESKKIAQKANVSTVPGYMGVIKDDKEAVKIANKIGYPVMIKAAAGGGGKGMRVAHSKKEVAQAFSSASNEARNSFKDDRIFIEKFIEKPRHIEIQVIADKYGNIVCLGERECSVQRHHQKVIEEAPSSFVDEKIRQKMMKQCASLAKEVGYFSAGTVEFIMDKEKHFYFLEMNTRLQVEHPVTELVYNVDLVEQMLRIAYGEKLPFSQKDIKPNGWAMEARIYAEDPARGFLPSSGRISEYHEPEENANVRVDSGVYEGGQVSMFYDAMVAKLITYGKDRAEAIDHMKTALGKYVVCGISHNISFLQALFSHERFANGDINTNFIEEEYSEGFSGAELTSEKTKILLCTAIHIFMEDTRRAAGVSGQISGSHHQGYVSNRWVVNIGDDSFPVFVKCLQNGYELLHDTEKLHVTSSWILGTRLFQGMVNGTLIHVQVEPSASGFYLTYEGLRAKVSVRSPRVAELEKFMPKKVEGADDSVVKAPISGLIVKMKVKSGDKVKKGQELFILEAMKMENIICAEKDGVVEKVHVGDGDNVSYDQEVIDWKRAS